MKNSLTPFAYAAALLAGCSGAPGNEYGPPVASLRGTITSATVATPADLHVALVWEHIDGNLSELKSAQEVGVRAEFPVHFQIDVNALPPEAAMNKLPAKEAANAGIDPNLFRFALGSVLVYQDGNGNGSLDLLPLDATTLVDKPLGAATPWLLYIEGTAPAPNVFNGATVAAGFNLLVEDDAACAGVEFCRPTLKSIPLATDLAIALSGDPKLSEMLCQTAVTNGGSTSGGSGSGSSGSGSGGGPAGGTFVPPPADWPVECSTDKRSFSAEKCEHPTLCGGTTCTSTSFQLQPGDAIPAGWPCP